MNFFGMFGNKSDENIRLISLVNKIENHKFGVFANIQNDLGKYIDKVGENEDKLRFMAYGYARRVSGAILTGSPGANVIMSCCARGTVGSIILILTLTGSLSRAPFDTM